MADQKREFPPKLLVPADRWIVVKFDKVPKAGKPFVKDTADGKVEIQRTNIMFRIADRFNEPLCGQPHIFQTSSWISAGYENRSASKLYDFIEAIAGRDIALAYDRTDANTGLTADDWKRWFGVYAARFSEPRKNDDGTVALDEKGGIAWQSITEVARLVTMRWKKEDVYLWPPPDRTATPQQSPPASNPVPQQKPVSTGPAPNVPAARPAVAPSIGKTIAPPPNNPFPRIGPDLTIAQVDEHIKASMGNHRELIRSVVSTAGKTRVSELSEDTRRQLWVMMQIESYMYSDSPDETAVAVTEIDRMLELRGVERFESLEASDQRLLLQSIEQAIEGHVPF